MVKEKNRPSLAESLRRQAEDFNERNPVIKERWYVVEVTPSRYVHDTHGGYWTEGLVVAVSPYFYSDKKFAQQWMDEHEPDEGKRLEIRHNKLRRYTYEKWGTV